MKLAIIGKPGIGKTTIAHILEYQYPKKIVVVPDKLDVIKQDLIPETKNLTSHKSYQKALFYFQRELEDIVHSCADERLVVCDGGTLDVLKYWPGSLESFFDDVHSTLKNELDRYDWVLQIFSEDDAQDRKSNRLLDKKNYWLQHPRYLTLTRSKEFNSCVKNVSKIMNQIIKNTPYSQVLSSCSELAITPDSGAELSDQTQH